MYRYQKCPHCGRCFQADRREFDREAVDWDFQLAKMRETIRRMEEVIEEHNRKREK